MATYNTVPDDDTSSLQNKHETKSLKYIVAGAAAASFLIGVALATAIHRGRRDLVLETGEVHASVGMLDVQDICSAAPRAQARAGPLVRRFGANA